MKSIFYLSNGLIPGHYRTPCIIDIDSINEKIDQIEENSYTNDDAKVKIMNSFSTVDEINEALYVLKSRIEVLVDHDMNLKTVIKSFEARIAALESKSNNYLNRIFCRKK